MNANSSDEIKIKLSATNQSGMVAALHLIANKFNVKVKDKLVSKVRRDQSRVVVIFQGTLNVTLDEFTNAIESHSRIYSIDDVEVKPNLKIYSGDDIESDTDDNADDDIDFESIVNAVDDIESDSDLNVYADNDTEFDSDPNIYAEDEFESDSNLYDDDAELELSETTDIYNEENSPLKVSKEVSKEISYQFNANDTLSDESLKSVEEIFQDLLGPVASLFVSSAVIESTTIGELFLLLSDELDGEVKSNFLGLVKGLS